MKSGKTVRALFTVPLMVSLMVGAGSAEAMDKKSRNIALGVGLGLLAGAIASQGDPKAVVGGAFAGGLIGAAVNRDDRRHRRDDWRRRDRDRGPHHYRSYDPRY